MRVKKLVGLFLLSMMIGMPLQAAEVEMPAAVKSRLTKIFGSQPDSVRKSPVDGMLEATYGTELFYISDDGRYLVKGEMFDLKDRTNLTQKRLSKARLKLMDTVDKSDMITYKAKGKEKHAITVFTDIDCAYCQKLHKGMGEMNDLGITVHYLSYPRSGINTPSYYKAVSVWCSEDRNKAMDDAKLRGKVSGKRCEESPVKDEFMLGKKMGVSGTPSMILSDGTLLPGYLPPKRLAAMLDKKGVD
jgi:thiol:disulfide interchange protein DsbC